MRLTWIAAIVCLTAVEAVAQSRIDVDNRGIKVDPDEDVSSEYGRTIEKRNLDSLEDARKDRRVSFGFDGRGASAGNSQPGESCRGPWAAGESGGGAGEGCTGNSEGYGSRAPEGAVL